MANQVTEINVEDDNTDIVIFVHGFGVRYDSRGMFTDIKDSLPIKFGTVLFDFNSVSGKEVFLSSIKQQVKILQDIIGKTSANFPDKKISIVAHSMGCIITSLAMPRISGKVVFLAPPDNFGDDRLESYFRQYEGASEQDGVLVVPRKDGSISHIPIKFFKELTTIKPLEAMVQFANKRQLSIFQTTRDEVIGETKYGELLNIAKITEINADHNFTGKERKILIKKIIDTLSS